MKSLSINFSTTHFQNIFSFIILFILLSFVTNSTSAQIVNLHVEAEGDHIGILQSLTGGSGVGNVGLDLLRGTASGETDWRILNEVGNFRIQNGTDNFQSDGTTYLSILENGNVGIGCLNPNVKLSICNGEMAFTDAMAVTSGDKISLDGYNIGETNMVGLGYETSNYANGMGQEMPVSDLYFKAEGAHRWYSNANADKGASAKMVLTRDGNLGIGTATPDTKLQIVGGEDASLADDGFILLGESGGFNMVLDENEIQARRSGGASDLALQNAGGNVGIGTLTPEVRLHVATGTNATLAGGGAIQVGATDDVNLAIDNNEILVRDDSGTGSLSLQNDGGNVGIGTASPDMNIKLQVIGGTDASNTEGGFIQAGSSSGLNVAMDNNEIQARNNGGASELLVQHDGGDVLLCGLEGGQVGIGITSAANLPDAEYLLAVDGFILSEEIRVEMSEAWPDYVFEKDYELMPLEELEQSIATHQHLPGIPSAAEIADDGLVIGDMQRRMMEKIEELTLYVIELNKKNQKLEQEVELLKQK